MKYTTKKSRPKKSLGQNYLTDENICRNIVDSFNIQPDDCIIEIGPGEGAITRYLLEKTSNITAVEIDENNVEMLRKKFPELNVISEDFMKCDLHDFLLNPQSKIRNPKLRVIGNIPYNITTDIVFKLIDNHELIEDAQLMVQDEVARRFASAPNSKEYGIPSIMVQVFSEPKLLFKVLRTCFYPKPRVDSRIIHFDFRKNKLSQINDIIFFRKFVKAAFSTRRKMLSNSLKKLELDLSKSTIDFKRRAESLSVDEFIELGNTFS